MLCDRWEIIKTPSVVGGRLQLMASNSIENYVLVQSELKNSIVGLQQRVATNKSRILRKCMCTNDKIFGYLLKCLKSAYLRHKNEENTM